MTEIAVDRLAVSTFTVPTDLPESDGTAEWDATTIVVVETSAGDETGIGWTYGDISVGVFIASLLRRVVEGSDALRVEAAWSAMAHACRNAGRRGVGSMAIAAVDSALWDLKARLLGVPLTTALDQIHPGVPVYGSGGFTSYSDATLAEQLGGWVEQGIPRVKMKVGREPERDLERVRVAREAIGPGTELYVDANGAYTRAEAAWFAESYAALGVRWFEEPVSSDDVAGLRELRRRVPASIEIAAGEYAATLDDFHTLLDAEAVGCLQADATRCEGITGFRRVAALCEAHHVDLSAHCSPALHLHACASIGPLRHLEYFHDHVRIEELLFDGVAQPIAGILYPDLSRPGNGLSLKRADAERYAA
jgi:L-alanine-DL-glutamate epimerase-like enolase superfamily enzyme